MKKSILIITIILALAALCACTEDGAQAYVPPATDTPPVSSETDDISSAPAPDDTDGNSGGADAAPPPDTAVTPDPMVSAQPKEPQVVICIDPGHGGKDSGAEWNGRIEKDDTLALALKVAQQVEELGHIALLTRNDDSYPYFSERAETANNANADLFISLHRNSFVGAQGVEIWISYRANTTTEVFAENMLEAIAEVGITKNRGVKKGTVSSSTEDYYVNKLTDMPSCIIELGFITSDEDNRLYDENMDAYAKAIAEQAVKEALYIKEEAK